MLKSGNDFRFIVNMHGYDMRSQFNHD
jgi:hypothetical protein